MDLTPGSPEWQKRITASKVAAILGVSPWESPRSVWHAMRGDLPREEPNDAMRRGHYLEPAILAWWRDQHLCLGGADDWREQPSYTLGDWAAATPDAWAVDRSGESCLVEAKSASRDDDWGEPGTDAIPPYYLVQVQWQMHLSGVHLCYVPVLTSRLRFVEYVVPYYAEYGPELEQRMRAFYDSLSADEPPPLDDTVATYEAIRKLHKDIERGESVELTDVEAMSLLMSVARHKEFEGQARHWKSHALDRMGRAQYATHNGVRIARRQPRGEDVTFVVVAKPADLNPLEETA